MMVTVWFDGPQVPPSIIRKKNKSKKKIPVDGFLADPENTEKILPLAPKIPKKSQQVNLISKQETSDSRKSSGTDDNPILSVIVSYKKKKLIYLMRVANGNIYLNLRM